MASAFLRLFMVTVVVLILGFLAVFFVRNMGAQQTFAAPPHPWFQRDFWWVYAPSAEELCQGQSLGELSNDWIVAVPVTRGEKEWLIPCAQPINAVQFLKKSSRPDWLLKIAVHETFAMDDLIEGVAALDKDKHFAVWAESQKVAMYLRKKAPQWLYAADGASLLRLQMFESLWVETAFDFWPDFLVATASPHAAFHLDARGGEEVNRRKKRILWNWNEESDEEPKFPIQGIMTNRPSAAQQKFGKRL